MTLKRTHKLSGLCLHDREHQVPLDHAEPTGESITVFTREVVSESRQSEDLPWLLFLQGGPGFPSPRPMDAGGWLGWAGGGGYPRPAWLKRGGSRRPRPFASGTDPPAPARRAGRR